MQNSRPRRTCNCSSGRCPHFSLARKQRLPFSWLRTIKVTITIISILGNDATCIPRVCQLELGRFAAVSMSTSARSGVARQFCDIRQRPGSVRDPIENTKPYTVPPFVPSFIHSLCPWERHGHTSLFLFATHRLRVTFAPQTGGRAEIPFIVPGGTGDP